MKGVQVSVFHILSFFVIIYIYGNNGRDDTTTREGEEVGEGECDRKRVEL